MNRSRLTTLVLVITALAAPAAAQPSLSGWVGPGMTSIAGSDGATRQLNASAGFEHLLKSGRVRLSYDFDTGDYATPGDWRFLSHSAGASYRFTFGKDARHRVYVGGDGTRRRNGDSWSAANFNGAGAFANLELHPGKATVRTGYRLDVRRFASSPSLDQVQNSAFASVLASFETRTTVIGEVLAGTKHYDAGTTAGSDARQVTLLGRVAQSLAERTGLSFEVSRRHVGGDVAPALIETPASFFDDGIYDDMFASDATRATVSVKSITAGGIELGGAVAWLDKDYKATYAFDEDGAALPGVLRSDRVTQVLVEGVWPLLPSRTGSASLDLITGYDYTRHRSTSALYHYTAHALRFAIGVTF